MSGFFIVISGEHVSLCSWENSDFVTINLFDFKHRTADNGSGVVETQWHYRKTSGLIHTP